MTKKEFKTLIDVHVYGTRRESKLIAVFYDWKHDDENRFLGYKYCVYARACNATQKELIEALYALVESGQDTEWYIQVVIAQSDMQRFKVPITSGGLYKLVNLERTYNID